MSPELPPVGAAVPLVIVGIVGLPDRSAYAPVVATVAKPLTAPAAIAMAVEPAAVSRPAASTVNVTTDDAEP